MLNRHLSRLLYGEGLLFDDVPITAGTGTVIATELVGGRNVQLVKPVHGIAGAFTDVSTASGMPVQPTIISTDLTEVAINVASSGDNQIVALTAGQIIRVWAFWLKVNGAAGVDLKWRSATTDLHPALPFLHREGWVMPYQTRPWFTCTIAEALQLNLSAAIQVSGRLYYTKG